MRGRTKYRARARSADLSRTETEAAAAEGRCQGKLSSGEYRRWKAEERKTYRDPWQRLDFWLGVERSIS